MNCKFFIVNSNGYILPFAFDNYETVYANCDSNEMVYLSGSLEELEYCLESQEWVD